MISRTRHAKCRLLLLGAFVICMALALALICCMFSEKLFAEAELRQGNYAVYGISEDGAKAFAHHTIDFLRGRNEIWEPQLPFRVPASFQLHMFSVKQALTATVFVTVIALLAYILMLMHMFRNRAFDLLRYYLCGLLLAVFLLAALIGWCVIDFNGFWGLLHRIFISDGIFAINEPIMALFPLELFYDYLMPLAGMTCGFFILLSVPVVMIVMQNRKELRRSKCRS